MPAIFSVYDHFGDILLVTKKQHVIEGPHFMLEAGSCAWRAVHMQLTVPYLFMWHSQLEQDFCLSQKSILWRPDDVLDACQDIKVDPTRRIDEAAILLTKHGESQKRWLWVRVEQIWSVRISGREAYSLVYICDTGEHINALGEIIETKSVEPQELLYFASERKF